MRGNNNNIISRTLVSICLTAVLLLPGCGTEDKLQNTVNTMEPNSHTFTVKFVDWNGKIIDEKTYTEDEKVNVPADPARPEDDKSEYKFTGWVPEVDYESKEDRVYVADYETIKKKEPEITKEELTSFAEEIASSEEARDQADFVYNNYKQDGSYDRGYFEYVEDKNVRFVLVQVGYNELNKRTQQTLYIFSPDSFKETDARWVYKSTYTDPDTTAYVEIGSNLEDTIDHPENHYKYRFGETFYASDLNYKSDKTDYWIDLTDYIKANPDLVAAYSNKGDEKPEVKEEEKKADYIDYTEAHNHYGENQRVYGKVTSIGTSNTRGDTVYFINMSQNFKAATHFTGIVYPDVYKTLGFDLKSLVGKNIIISGKVQQYDGHAEIIVKSASQIINADNNTPYPSKSEKGSEVATPQANSKTDSTAGQQSAYNEADEDWLYNEALQDAYDAYTKSLEEEFKQDLRDHPENYYDIDWQ